MLTQLSALTLLVAVVLLFFGQRIYWLFVGAIGFVAGLDLALRWFASEPQWVTLLVAVIAGLVGIVLAIFFQKLAVAVAGFLAGGHFALLLLPNLGHASGGQFSVIVYVVAGIVAALLAVALLDWALIILSALIGAALIAQWAVAAPTPRALIFIVLFLIGGGAQASMRRRRAG
ncbi:MAG TPA: DUF4203 domain-containing protein [Chthoniobacterales bacterium]|nr:DUF4203 domain-containing protein [Chthoniobacterales bacterium]